jgi:nitroimidazol reductase NimA-like FMN-containing flavoprotein (pyridoxamine 5'-phosphate oxidase superfamily)
MTDPRLGAAQNMWVATVRPDGRPHLAPIWFVVSDDRWYFVTDPKSVKARNLHHNRKVALALEDGSKPHIVEGEARAVQPPAEVIRLFKQKYNWDITTDGQYTEVYEVQVAKRLTW